MDYSRPELADRLGAEYAAGLLRGAARRRFESLLPAHPVLRAAARAWQERLMPLTAEIEPQTPSAEVWQRIEARIHGTATAPGVATPGGSGAGWWRGLAFWRGLSALAGVAAVVLALVLANPESTKPPIVVVLSAATTPTGSAAPATFVASISPDGRAMVTKPLVNVALQPNRALELWSLPPSGAPRSLGTISADSATTVRREQVLQGTDKLAVTLEQAGGSPDGKPHGPVLYVGKLVS